jgi:hypothetical protein
VVLLVKPGLNLLTGAYIIIVFNTCDKMYDKNTIFHISKSDPSKCGHIVRIECTQNINIYWPPYSDPIINSIVNYIII